jgi:hypothetical protein
MDKKKFLLRIRMISMDKKKVRRQNSKKFLLRLPIEDFKFVRELSIDRDISIAQCIRQIIRGEIDKR